MTKLALILVAMLGGVEPDLSEAERLYAEGTTLYESADYEGAIASFTRALREVQTSGSKKFRHRGLLLYNIARAHIRAYEIDKGIGHLRQARAIYKQFIDEARVEAFFEQFDPQDVEDAKKELAALETRLKGLESSQKTPPPAPPAPSKVDEAPTTEWKKPRDLGIGLTAAGSAVLVTGVGLLAHGGTFKSAAESEIESELEGVPSDDPAHAEGAKFIDQETSKGRALMAVGGTLAAVGAVGVGVGVASLVKAKKLREGRVASTLAISPNFVGFVVQGRF